VESLHLFLNFTHWVHNYFQFYKIQIQNGTPELIATFFVERLRDLVANVSFLALIILYI
jgi:hypothetical protein